MFNIHGGLHLFQNDTGDIEKALNTGGGVIDTITNEIEKNGRLPLYVAEGDSKKKMRKINSVSYLRHCYEQLKKSTSVMFVYGHSANDTDSHIYDAIRSSKQHVYFGIYDQGDENVRTIRGQLERFIGEDKYTLFCSKSAQVWGNSKDDK